MEHATSLTKDYFQRLYQKAAHSFKRVKSILLKYLTFLSDFLEIMKTLNPLNMASSAMYRGCGNQCDATQQ